MHSECNVRLAREGDGLQQLTGRVAVVTGAASGIGWGLARGFAQQGMRVALADVEEPALSAAEAELHGHGHEVLARPTDVSDPASVEALAAAVYEHFGAVHVVCNNAGVAGGGSPVWQTTTNDWRWVLGVNLMGVVHGIQSFVPRMIASGEEGHVVNTSSVLGLSTGSGSIYSVTKHAVARLTEGLYYDLQAAEAPIGVSLLCPGLIATHIVSAERNRPEELRNPGGGPDPERARMRQAAQERFLTDGMPPEETSDIVVRAIRENEFYVFTHPEMARSMAETRLGGILDGAPRQTAPGSTGRRPAGRDA